MNNKRRTIVELDRGKYQLYVDADNDIKERLGISPGPEFLMALFLENETDSADLADVYCHTVLRGINA